MATATAAPLSLLERLPPDLLALTCTFLSPQPLLRSLPHVNHRLSFALSPACFRGSFVIGDRLINDLAGIPTSAFSLLRSASSLSVHYGDAYNGWSADRTLFSASVDGPLSRSLLCFSSILSLSLRYCGSFDFVNGATPLELFLALLRKTPAKQKPLPLLQQLHVHGVPHYDYVDEQWKQLARLPSLTQLLLHALEVPSMQEVALLLHSPTLTLLDLSACDLTRMAELDEVQRMAKPRGVEVRVPSAA